MVLPFQASPWTNLYAPLFPHTLGLPGGCEAGFTLKRRSQLVAFAIQSFSRSVETWRRYGWLRMVFPSQVRASSELHFGALREGGGTREVESTVAESLVTLYRVGTHQIRRRRRAARSSTSQGRAENPCARESKARTGRFLREKLISDHGIFLPTRATRSGERARFVGLFQECTGL